MQQPATRPYSEPEQSNQLCLPLDHRSRLIPTLTMHGHMNLNFLLLCCIVQCLTVRLPLQNYFAVCSLTPRTLYILHITNEADHTHTTKIQPNKNVMNIYNNAIHPSPTAMVTLKENTASAETSAECETESSVTRGTLLIQLPGYVTNSFIIRNSGHIIASVITSRSVESWGESVMP